VVFEKLVQVLVFGCAYWRIADKRKREKARWTGQSGASNARWRWMQRGSLLGWPLGANRHDSPLLAPTLEAVDASIELPDDARVHLDRAYDDSKATGELLEDRGLVWA
jgi:hypothetical protein